MFCKHCGKEIPENAAACPYCGTKTAQAGNPGDGKSAGYAVLGFFFPIVGLILYLVWKDNYPLRAKSAGKGALIGVIVSVVFGIIYGVIAGAAIASMMSISAAGASLVL